MKRTLISLLFFALPHIVWSQSAPELLQNPVYLKLLADFEDEVKSGEFAKKDSPETNTFLREWKKFVSGQTTQYPASAPGINLPDHWPPKQVENSSEVRSAEFTKINVEDISQKPHALHDPETYTKNRLGESAYDLIKRHEVDVAVYAGLDDSFTKWEATQDLKLTKVPSLYEQWGISKYLAFPKNEKPRLYYIIPPINEYAHHYSSLLGLSGINGKKVFLNLDDRKEFKKIMRDKAQEIMSKISGKVDYLVMGYQNQWDTVLQSLDPSEWQIASTKNFSASSHGLYDPKMKAKLINLKNIKKPGLKMSILSLGADSTIWGEATSFMMEPFLELRPKAVYFGGSAGALDEAINPYTGITPEKFTVDGTPIALDNKLAKSVKSGIDQRGTEFKVSGLHGKSNSPAEQTLDFITQMKAKGITSLDVEQSLLAETIHSYNQRTGQKINYLAINLVTDKPGSTTTQFGLDNIDQVSKGRTRLSIVDTIFKTAATETEAAAQVLDVAELDKIRKDMIKKAFPGITDAQIFMKNGIGRVDVNPDVKFSYYIFTDDPFSSKGKTTLIPMATSRYTPTYYHTDEWWDENEEAIAEARRTGQPMPRQDPEEVRQWLIKNKLSTNPEMFSFSVDSDAIQKKKLQDFLLAEYLRKNVVDGNVILYRGAEKLTEIGEWERGIRPRGIRYWTPDVTYAWRYGRKHAEFLDGLLTGKPPVLKYEIKVDTFIQMVRDGELTLGTELTKRVHENFDDLGYFADQLNNNEHYLGNADWGVEFEVRANRKGSLRFTSFYKGPVSMAEMSAGFEKNMVQSVKRLNQQFPELKTKFSEMQERRLKDIKLETQIVEALKAGKSRREITHLTSQLTSRQITNYDSKDFVQMATAAAPESCSDLLTPRPLP